MNGIWNNKNFVKLWFGQLVSILGDQLHFIAMMVLIQDFYGDIVVTGTVMMVTALPKVLFSPFAGVLVDRWSLKKTMVIADLLRMVLVLFIPFTFIVLEVTDMSIIFILTFLISTISVFFYPAKSASIPTLVEKDKLLVANSVSGSTQMIVSLLGLIGGAVLVSIIGTTGAFIIDASSFLISAIFISMITFPHKSKDLKSLDNKDSVYFKELKSGAKYIINDPLLRFLLIFFTSIMLVAGAINVLLFAYVQDILHKDASFIGYLAGANMVGMLIGMALIPKITNKYPKEKLLVFATLIFAITLINISYIDVLILVIPLMVINGLGNGILNVVASTIFQEHVIESMRGRVFSFIDAAVNSAAIISMLPAAWLAKQFGVQRIFLVTGIFIIGFFLYSLKKVNEIYDTNIDKPENIKQSEMI
ncbi:hypothetical protein BHF71_06230 [Vulcanibacillus modesticaldus]|uniref:Major facilitator superfamily (MFS) profile domain-containing protein n=1 Tax=Vulcanibacillus modesticaldus TaxID=337097 RepID=A0A1D2YWM6_9BACI|nr:MFS transporter [Vulcanibacillus modesticaldus]OEG00120.1 hypothetical protein BHF71_06230 [Vulcanibacillus modesticaldus]